MGVISCYLCLPSSWPSTCFCSSSVVQSGDEATPSLDGEALQKNPSTGNCPPEVEENQREGENPSGGDSVDANCDEGLSDSKAGIILKSSLKKNREAEKMDSFRRGTVKWMDILGKELVDVQEFEPSESEGSELECSYRGCCSCVIQ